MLPLEPAADAGPDDAGAAPLGDLSALAWVHDELRRSLEAAQKSLRRALRDVSNRALPAQGDGLPVPLVQARVQLHQAVGALEMIGLSSAARCAHASELAVVRLTQAPERLDADGLATLDRASFALQDYLRRQLAGHPVSPLALFPSYRAVMSLAGEARVHPADLCPPSLPGSSAPPAWAATAPPRALDANARAALERAVLAGLRTPGDPAPLQRLSELCAGLAAGAPGLGGGTVATGLGLL